MKWFNIWLANSVNKGQQQREESQWLRESTKMAIGQAVAIDRGRAEGEDRITFELSTAVGGRILNVRRYDERKDRNENQTYVIPNGEDVGERVAKIINLEMFRG